MQYTQERLKNNYWIVDTETTDVNEKSIKVADMINELFGRNISRNYKFYSRSEWYKTCDYNDRRPDHNWMKELTYEEFIKAYVNHWLNNAAKENKRPTYITTKTRNDWVVFKDDKTINWESITDIHARIDENKIKIKEDESLIRTWKRLFPKKSR